MNIGTITTSGVKGQIVIPADIRKALNITPETPLQIMLEGKSIAIHPVTRVVRAGDPGQSVMDILAETAGAWAGDDWPETEKRRRSIELAASAKRKKAW